MIVFHRVFIGAFFVETLQMGSISFSGAFEKKRGTAIGARLRNRFVPYGKGALRITGASIENLAPL